MGNAVWELLACEHGINKQGKLAEASSCLVGCPKSKGGEDIEVFFRETRQRYSPRAILVDLEPTVIGK